MGKNTLLKVINRIDCIAKPEYCNNCKCGTNAVVNISFDDIRQMRAPFVLDDLFLSAIEELSKEETKRREYIGVRRLLTGAVLYCGRCIEAYEEGNIYKAEKNKKIRRNCLIEARNGLEKLI